MISEIDKMVEDFEHGRLGRRQLVAALVASAAAMSGLPTLGGARAGAREAGSTFAAKGIDHVALRVTDVARSRDFYVEHLGLEVSRDASPSSCFLDSGPDFLALFRSSAPGLDHFSFGIEDYSADRAVDRLTAAGLQPIRHGNRVYFDDPDGIQLQVSRHRV